MTVAASSGVHGDHSYFFVLNCARVFTFKFVVSDPTDTVCVIGVINVKCMGSVRAGERIYATVDLENPGTAIPESHLPPSVVYGRTSILLGMSMEEKKASKLDDVNLVQCFVCIVLGVSDKEITAEIETMYDHFEMDLAVKLRRERTKMRRREYCDVLPTKPGKERAHVLTLLT